MSFLLKDPEAVLDYAVDWGAEYLAGDALAESSWSVSPDESIPPSVSRIANGEAMRPLSPSHLRGSFNPDGSVTVGWVRRSRLAWGWVDEIEAAVDNGFAGYRLKAIGSTSSIERDLTVASVTLSPAEALSLGAGAMTIEVRQIGPLALSRPATITINE